MAGSPIEDSDLVFHILRGLPKVFNGFKTALRTRGGTLTFAELVNMLNGEDLQLVQESSSDNDLSSVLVVTHGIKSLQVGDNVGFSSTGSSSVAQSSQMNTQVPSVQNHFGVPMQYAQNSQFGNSPPQYVTNVQKQFMPQLSSQHMSTQQFGYQNFKPRGKGRASRMPCEICGRSNHTTNYCYYKGQVSTRSTRSISTNCC